MGLCTFFDVDMVTVMWSKTLKVSFVGDVEDDMYVVDFSRVPTKTAICLMAKVDVGWLWHRRLAHVNMRSLQTLLKGDHVIGLTNVIFAKDLACRACESAFTPKWCFGIMTMWLVGLMTGVKDLSQVIRSLVASTDAVVPSLTKKEKTACFWTWKFFSVTFES